jgi:hypothetical protein
MKFTPNPSFIFVKTDKIKFIRKEEGLTKYTFIGH